MPAPKLTWHPIDALREQLALNLDALRTRDSALAARVDAASSRDWFISGDEDRITLGTGGSMAAVQPVPNPLPPGAAAQVAGKLFRGGACSEPVVVAGLDHGWLWNTLYTLEVATPRTPGHRPPLYLLARDPERFRVVLHFHDWTKLLADQRVRLFIGDDCVQGLTRSLIENPLMPWPRLCVTVDPSIWPAGVNLDSVLRLAHESIGARMSGYSRQLAVLDAASDPDEIARRFFSGAKLRVLGITSRFTTFLQYSMRDWLAAFKQLGHETRLLIEQCDHEIVNPLEFSRVCSDFRPDLILMIDHYRGEFSGLPQRVPCVMWIQDRLPNIFRPEAGRAQTDMDFVIGYGRQECALSLNYPPERFMPAMVGFNENRFAARELSAAERERFACDVSFVSHASVPAEVLVQQEIDKASDKEAAKFLSDLLDRLRGIYDAGGFVTEASQLKQIIGDAMRQRGVETSSFATLVDFFVQRVNNALFRQQAVGWLAEMGLNLHLYGRGWENHPRFKRFARGIADNEQQLSAIYQASAINMQITPFGAVHQRLCDGISAGGFFLLRHVTGDACDRIYQQMWPWVTENAVRSGPQLFKQAAPHVRALLDRINELTGDEIDTIPDRFFFGLDELATDGFTRSASTLWPGEYDRVAFATRAELQSRVTHFLKHADERRQIVASMRNRLLNHFSYRAITQRMLRFIADAIAARDARLAA